MNITVEHVAAKKVLDWYMERLAEDDTGESKDILQYCHLQLAKYKADGVLNMLYSYPITVTDGE